VDYIIDVTGTCNLRCPSCPVGNFDTGAFIGAVRPKGFMSLALFEQVIDKIKAESAGDDHAPHLYLYNWGESLIHPEIVRFMGLINERGLAFSISSNLNNDADYRAIVRAKPTTLRVSLSGHSNGVYQQGHRGGDVHLVISNLYRLRHSMDKVKTSIDVEVFYHVYRDNCGDELLRIHALCEQLGFRFCPGTAYFMPLEKLIYHVEGSDKFTADDQRTMDRMWVSIQESLQIASRSSDRRCVLQEGQIAINHDGSVPICCGVYDPLFTVAPDFLAIDREALQARRRSYELCRMCTDMGLHNVAVYKPQQVWDSVVAERQKAAGVKVITRMFSAPAVMLNV
jgi:MoaA/NifB/PqqE/SkfB family radical SAM enzyme